MARRVDKMTDYQALYDSYRARTEQALEACFQEDCPQRELLEAMRYSLLAGGKRIRPVLTLAFCEAAGGNMEDALNFACGVEMLHTYSLIHDDLPCMDNDDLRRGKPTCHKVYGETVATLAGDALQAEAFGRVVKTPTVSAAKAAACLARAVGSQGMCSGQYLDTVGDGKSHTEAELRLIHGEKTGALLVAACQMGLCSAETTATVTDEMWAAAQQYASALGMAFQIRDDILDEISTTEELGKPVGSDEANGKQTFVTLIGVPACEALVEQHTNQAKEALQGVFPDAGFLCWLADRLAGRRK